MKLKADLLLADDHKARRTARGRGLVMTGVLGVLEHGSAKGLLDLTAAIGRLRSTDFFLAESVIEAAHERDLQRRANR